MGKPKGISSKGTKVPHADNQKTRTSRAPGEGVAGAGGGPGTHHRGSHPHANHRPSNHTDMANTLPTFDVERNAKFEAEGRKITVQK